MDKFTTGLNKVMNKIGSLIQNTLKIQPFLGQMDSGKFIKNILSILLRIYAILLGIVFFAIWVISWYLISDLSVLGKISYIIWQLTFLVASFLVVKILYLRAMEIPSYPESDFVVVPVIAMLIKAWGEMSFMFLAVMSLPLTLITWFAGRDLEFIGEYLSWTDSFGTIFLAGIMVLILTWIMAFQNLFMSRYIAEWNLALFSIANDANIIRKNKISKTPLPSNISTSEN